MNQLICRPIGRFTSCLFTAILMMAICCGSRVVKAAETMPVFSGEKTTWHGFDRYDFVMDDATLAITPFKSPPTEGDGVNVPAPAPSLGLGDRERTGYLLVK
jgi:hypothetical protein